MIHIAAFAFLGLLAGMIAGFWTHIIGPKMIFSSVGRWIESHIRTDDQVILDNFNRRALTLKYALLEKFCFMLQCICCFTVWIAILLDLFYILYYTPGWIFCVIGVFASLGTSHFIAEIIYISRK